MARRVEESEIGGITISHPDKILFPDCGVTKRDVAEYYAAIAPYMLIEMANRPLSFFRCPGDRAHCFVQKHPEGGGFEGLPRVKIQENNSRAKATYLYATKPEHIVEALQQNCLEFHPWCCQVSNIEKPDRLIFDLDPGEGVRPQTAVKLAHTIREVLEQLKLRSFVRVSGGKGLHVVVPIAPLNTWDKTYQWAKSFADVIAGEAEYVTVDLSKAKRKGKIFLDYLRNNRGATAIASFSVRARAGAPVAMPIDWSELTPKTRFDGFSMQKTLDTVSAKGWKNPWRDMAKLRQKLPEL